MSTDSLSGRTNPHAARERRWVEQDILFRGRHLTWDVWVRALKVQKNRCAVCGTSFAFEHPVADHDHKTRQFRGALCFRCNRRRVGVVERGFTLHRHPDAMPFIRRYLANPPASRLRP